MFQSFQKIYLQPMVVPTSLTKCANSRSSSLTNGSAKSKSIELPRTFQPRDIDILCGRGRGIWDHKGNRQFKQRIQSHAVEYSTAKTNMDKGAVVASMVDEMRGEGVLFVKKDMKAQVWYDIGEYHAREKTSHALRDYIYRMKTKGQKSTSKRRSMTKVQPEHDNNIDNDTNCLQSTIVGEPTTLAEQPPQPFPVVSMLSLSSTFDVPSTVSHPPPDMNTSPRRVSVESIPSADLDDDVLNLDEEEKDFDKTWTKHDAGSQCTNDLSHPIPIEPVSSSSLLDEVQATIARAETVIQQELERMETIMARGQVETLEETPCVVDEDVDWSELFPL